MTPRSPQRRAGSGRARRCQARARGGARLGSGPPHTEARTRRQHARWGPHEASTRQEAPACAAAPMHGPARPASCKGGSDRSPAHARRGPSSQPRPRNGGKPLCGPSHERRSGAQWRAARAAGKNPPSAQRRPANPAWLRFCCDRGLGKVSRPPHASADPRFGRSCRPAFWAGRGAARVGEEADRGAARVLPEFGCDRPESSRSFFPPGSEPVDRPHMRHIRGTLASDPAGRGDSQGPPQRPVGAGSVVHRAARRAEPRLRPQHPPGEVAPHHEVGRSAGLLPHASRRGGRDVPRHRHARAGLARRGDAAGLPPHHGDVPAAGRSRRQRDHQVLRPAPRRATRRGVVVRRRSLGASRGGQEGVDPGRPG